MRRILFSFSIFLIVSHASAAFGFKFPDASALSKNIDFQKIQFTADYDFEGIVGLSNCSGSLVKYDDSLDSDYAMVLSNGHCVGMLDPGEVIINRTSTKRFNVLDPNSKKLGTVKSRKIMYATMTDTDLALFQLNVSYEYIMDRFNVEPLVFGRGYPKIGTPIEIISGYWKRGYSCHIELMVHRLKEANWTMRDSLRYSRPGCNIIGGTSGSPVIEAGTRTVIAVNNTINENGRRCTMNNPCEVDEDGNVTYKKGYGYAQQTSWLYNCRNSRREINLNAHGCKLPRP